MEKILSKSTDYQERHARKASLPLKLAAAGIAAVLLLPVLAVLALHIPAIQQQIIDRAVSLVEKTTNCTLGMQSFRWWPFSELYIQKPRVEVEGKPILDCDNVRVSYSFLTSSPYIRIELVRLEKPFLQLERTPEGKWRIPLRFLRKPGVSAGNGEPYWAKLQLPRLQVVSGLIEGRQQGKTILSVKDVTGFLQLQAIQGLNGREISVDFKDILASADFPGIGTWNFAGSALLQKGELSTNGITISAPDGGRAQLRGCWNIADFQKGQAEVNLSDFSIDPMAELYPQLPFKGNLSGRLELFRDNAQWSLKHDIERPGETIRGNLSLTGASGKYELKQDSHFSGLKIPGLAGTSLNGRLSLSAAFRDGKLEAADFSAHFDPSLIFAENIQQCDFNGFFENNILTIKSSSVKSTVADFKFSATADLGGFFSETHRGGIRSELTVERANLEKLNSRVQQRIGGTISLEASHEPGKFRYPRLWHSKIGANLNIPEFISLKLTGSYQNEQLKADYNIECRETGKFSAISPQWEGKGRVASRGTVSGKWPDILLDAEINSPKFAYSSITADNIAVRVKGRMPKKEERHEISLKAQNLLYKGNRISSLALELDQQQSGCSYKLKSDGLMNQFSAQLSGRLENIWEFPRISASTRGQYSWKDQAGTIEAQFDFDKQSLKINSAILRQGKQKLVLSSGTVSESGTDLKLALEFLNLGQISAALGHKDTLTGLASGQIHISGKPDQPECRLNVQASDILIRGKQQVSSAQFQGVCTRDSLSVRGEVSAPGMKLPLGFNARIPVRLSLRPPGFEIRQADEMSCELKIGGLDSGALLPMLPFLSKAGGLVEGEARIGGTIKQPVVIGSGTWTDGFFQEKRWAHIIDNIRAEWQADSRKIYVKNAEVSHLGGAVTVTGHIDYPRFQTMEFKADGKDLQVHDLYGIEGRVSGNAEIRQTPDTAELVGTLNLSKAQMSLGQLETDIAQNIQIIETNAKGDLLEIKDAKSQSKFYNKLKMDVGIVLPDSGTWVTGKGLKAEIGGGLKLVKNPGGPLKLVGELQALRGTYSFQGKELKITEGSLIFTGSPTPDPLLRIVSQKQVKDILLQALVSGPLSKPRLSLSSIPALNRVDVMSYFMFDHPAGDLNASQSVQLQDGAAAWLGSETSNVMRSMFGNNPFAPDSLGYRSTVGKGERGFTNRPDPVNGAKESGIIEIGKHITPDLYVTYGRSIKGEQANEMQVEYRLNRNLSVQTQVGGAEQSGIDVFWRHDFGK